MRRLAMLLAGVLVGIGLTGCGGSHRMPPTTTALTLPRSLAHAWAVRADAIAAAASAGHGCQAQTLADSLRDDVVAADTRVPAAFRTKLLESVNELANRITCTPPPKTATTPPPQPSAQPHGHHQKRPKHGQGNQGNQGD